MKSCACFKTINIWLITARAERYNHELETEDTDIDEPEDTLFHSFSSMSPRFSKVYSRIEELHEVSTVILASTLNSIHKRPATCI